MNGKCGVGNAECGIVLLFLLLISCATHAADPLETFSSPEEQNSFQTLTHNLRCVVCQNQSLAESNAPLADDLRKLIRKQLQEGKSEQDIRQFMVERYGTFVLYEPPFGAQTFLLWIMPVGLLLLGIWMFYRFFFRRTK